MNAKHTPAPWRLGAGGKNIMSERAAIIVRDNKRPSQRIAEVLAEAHDIPGEEADANARLIAESPVLLDIAERVWKHAKIDDTLPVLLLQDIEAAIARVKGA